MVEADKLLHETMEDWDEKLNDTKTEKLALSCRVARFWSVQGANTRFPRCGMWEAELIKLLRLQRSLRD